MNKSFNIISKATLFFSFAFIFMSCQNTEVNNEESEVVDLEEQDVEESQSDIDLSVSYQVPTPNELFTLFLILSIKFFSFFNVSSDVFIDFLPIGFSINLLSSISP